MILIMILPKMMVIILVSWFPQVIDVEAPVLGEDGNPSGDTKTVSRDQGMRETTM